MPTKEQYWKNPEKYRRLNKESRLRHLEKERERNRRYRRRHKEKITAYHRKWYASNGSKKTKANIIAGKFPLAKFCELCPEDDKRKATQRHHFDYDYPELYISICSQCHYFADRDRLS